MLRSIMFKNYTHVFTEFSVADLTLFTHPLTSKPLSDYQIKCETQNSDTAVGSLTHSRLHACNSEKFIIQFTILTAVLTKIQVL